MKRLSLAIFIVLLLLVNSYVFAQERSLFEQTIPPLLPSGLIKGKVTDTMTPRANNLDSAIVIARNELLLGLVAKTVTTDSTGNYEITNLPAGEYLVTVTKSGYDESTDYVTVTPGGESFHDVRLYKKDTLMSYFWKLGPLRWPLLSLSLLLLLAALVTVVYIIYYIHRLNKSKSKVGQGFMSRVVEALQKQDIMGTISICDEIGGFARILKAGLLRYTELSGVGGIAGEGIQHAIWKESVREAMGKAGDEAKRELKFHWSLVAIAFAAIGGMALLYGLFGTVTGAIRALTIIALKGTGDLQLLAGGISEASLTSIIGLAIAIPSVSLCLIAFVIHKILDKDINAFISRIQRDFAEVVITGQTGIAEVTVFAGFWRRFLALLIDNFVLTIFTPVSLAGTLTSMAAVATKGIKPGLAVNVGIIFTWLLTWLYYALMESSFNQATFGKMAVGIAVTDLNGEKLSFSKATGRYFSKIVSVLILMFGFIMAGVTRKKQALHDIMAGSLVVRRK